MVRRLLICAALCAAAFAQKKSDEKSPDVGAVDFTVEGAEGEFVSGLAAADFAITQEGKPVKVTRLIPPSPSAARTLVVVVDDLGLSVDGLNLVQKTLRRFVAEQVRPGDRISFIRTGVHSGGRQSLTSDPEQLTAAIDGMNHYLGHEAGTPGLNPLLSGTLLQLRFTMTALRRTHSRSGVVLLSERFGTPRGTGTEGAASVEQACARITDLANQAAAVFYAVPVRPAPDKSSPPKVDTGLAAVVRDTGGLWIDSDDLAGALSGVLADQARHYVAEFEAVSSTFDYTLGDANRKRLPGIAVRALPPRHQVRARAAVYSKEDEDASGFRFLSNDSDDESAATSPLDGGDIALRPTLTFSHSATEGSVVDVTMHVEGKNLTFVRSEDGQYRAALGIVGMAFDSYGGTVGEAGRSISYALNETAYKSVVAQGFMFAQRIPVRRNGAFQIRLAITDDATGRVGSAGEYIEIPDVESGEFAVSGLALRPAASTAAEPAGTIREGAALRIFRPGSRISYTYQVYNLISEPAKKARVELGVRFFRSGKPVFTGAATVVSLEHSPLKAHSITGNIGLNPEMTPGRYVLHLTTTDQGSEKPRSVAQWIDLEVRP
jgi:VWFA-related protein